MGLVQAQRTVPVTEARDWEPDGLVPESRAEPLCRYSVSPQAQLCAAQTRLSVPSRRRPALQGGATGLVEQPEEEE